MTTLATRSAVPPTSFDSTVLTVTGAASPAFRVMALEPGVIVEAGPVPAALAAHARAQGARLWALFTAANPHSLPLSAESNGQRHRALLRSLTEAGIRHEPAETGCGGTGSEAVLVWNVAPARALGLARSFAQRTVLYGDLEHARVVACDGLEFFI